MDKYDYVISLGYTCSAAGYIHASGLRDGAYPFDHMWSPMWAVNEMIKNDFKDVLSLKDLECTVLSDTDDVKWIYNRKYDIAFAGDARIFRYVYQELKKTFFKRTKRLFDVLNNSEDKTVLFVRLEESDKGADMGTRVVKKDVEHNEYYYVKKFSELIKQKFPNLKFKVLYLNHANKDKFVDEKHNIVGVPGPNDFSIFDFREPKTGSLILEYMKPYNNFLKKYL